MAEILGSQSVATGQAPALAVSGVAPEPVTIQSLTAGGCAILLFVNEDCPTSAHAMRMLGPLGHAWEQAGVSCTAVFEDPLEVAIRVARRCGWAGRVVSEAPPYQTSRAYGLSSVPTAFLIDHGGQIATSVTGWDHAAITELIERAAAATGVTLAIPEPAEPLHKPGCSSKAALDPAIAAAMAARPDDDEMEEMFERGWTDGLPVVPPTSERVEKMLGSFLADTSLGQVPPAMGEATLERLAACAVLAGCRPEYFPVVVAAGKAALDGRFNLHGQAVTTQPAGQLIVVNGPVRHELGMNSGMGVLGPGNRANLTIGRALRLMIELTGGGMPGTLDRSTLGQMGKIGFCIAEDEEVSPWSPLHVERGFGPAQSVVTLIGCDAPLSISDHRSRTPEDLAYILAWAAASTWSTNWWPLTEPSVFIICPEHAEMFRAHGWTKPRLREYMFEVVHKSAKDLSRGETTPHVHRSDPDAQINKWASPEQIILLVAGGEAGRYSAVLGPCTGMGSEIVSAEVERR